MPENHQKMVHVELEATEPSQNYHLQTNKEVVALELKLLT